mmetsp:Transcript_11255/g.24865  ORF Transcript_11255/g.24865 Transcript_11255/m.24865 type:complete len:82 (-) Transcript_11255:225-470(-)
MPGNSCARESLEFVAAAVGQPGATRNPGEAELTECRCTWPLLSAILGKIHLFRGEHLDKLGSVEDAQKPCSQIQERKREVG